MHNKRVGVGIIGTGFARSVQIPAFLASDSAFISSVASGSIENAQTVATQFGISHATADWHETVTHPQTDIVCITTPPNLHHEMTLFAVDQGKHVICEKPMAMSFAEAEQMTRAAEGKPLIALIDHELRFQAGRQHALAMLRDGAIGDVRHAKWLFQAPHRGDASLPWNWWSDADAGGGALGAIASHIIDGFHWLLSTDVERVFCQLHTQIKERRDERGVVRAVTSDDEANLLLRFADSGLTKDATGLISVSMTEGPGYRNECFLYGTKGVMKIGHRGEVFLSLPGDTDWTSVDVDLGDDIPGNGDTGFSRGFLAFARVLIDAVNKGATEIEHGATFEDGTRVQKVLDAARESDRSGRAVHII